MDLSQWNTFVKARARHRLAVRQATQQTRTLTLAGAGSNNGDLPGVWVQEDGEGWLWGQEVVPPHLTGGNPSFFRPNLILRHAGEVVLQRVSLRRRRATSLRRSGRAAASSTV